jgi:hypothetical protein
MSRASRRLVIAVVLVVPGGAFAGDAAPATDYAQPASWACRPGAEDACTAGLDAVAATIDGRKTPQPFRAATDPAIDCFYVYPTVSREDRPYSDLAPDAAVMGVIRHQAGRLATRCRLFAPLYRQATLAHLHDRLAGRAGHKDELDSDVPFEDVAAAWNDYLTRDNHGRGVVLVGHSQGAILLQRLIAEQIDGKPVQGLLVAAFLAGDPSLGVPAGKVVGGTFAHVPACTTGAQVGCVYAWGSYRDGDDASPRAFGRARRDGLVSHCSNPAAPGGGKGLLKSYFPPSEPGGSWLEAVGQFSATCRTDAEGDALRVTVEAGPDADVMRTLLKRAEHIPRWGLHTLDIALYLGNILDLIDAETGVWIAGH